MIALVEGLVVERGLDGVVLMTAAGVGYFLHASLQTLAQVPEEGASVRLHAHTHVREDTLQLYGFAQVEEREVFLLLTTIPGVGPKVALGILSGLSVPDLARAVRDGDTKRLQSAPGVGKKTAERLALELKDKLAPYAAGVAPAAPAGSDMERALDDLRSALVNLGYRGGDIERIVRSVRQELGDSDKAPRIEELVRLALRLSR